MENSKNYIDKVKAFIVKLNYYLGLEEMPGKRLQMFAEDLSVLSPDELKYIADRIRKGTFETYGKFPLPGKLIELARGSAEQRSEIAAGLVIEAVSKYGSWQYDAARQHFGEIGDEIVRSMGGWDNLCASLTAENTSYFKSLMIKAGRAAFIKAELGNNGAPSLSHNKESDKKFKEYMKSLFDSKQSGD